jgi:type IV pilus assembly protein PilC
VREQFTEETRLDSLHNPSNEPIRQERATYMTDSEAGIFCQVFADALSAGMGYARIFDFIEGKVSPGILLRLREAVLTNGDQLGEAFAKNGILEPAARKLILVAEEQGELPHTFTALSRAFRDRYDRIRRFVLGFVEVIVFLCLCAFLMCMGEHGYEYAMGSLDMLGFLAATAQEALGFWVFFIGGYSVTGMIALNMPVDSSFRDAMTRIWYRTPIVSKPLRLQAISRFMNYLRLSIESGMPINRCFELATEASNSPWFLASTPRVLANLDRGGSLLESVAMIRGMPEEAVEHISLGEETGRLDERLVFLEEKYAALSDEWYTRLLAALLYMLRFALIIGAFAMLAYLAISHLSAGLPI